jgi:hypothetical protein
MRQITIGEITIDAVIEREGPWRRPATAGVVTADGDRFNYGFGRD